MPSKVDGNEVMISFFRAKKTVAPSTSPNHEAQEVVSPQASEMPLMAHEIHDGFVQDAMAAKMLLDSVLSNGLPEGESRAQVQRATELVGRCFGKLAD